MGKAEDKKDILAMRKIQSAARKVKTMLAEHDGPEEIAAQYEELRRLLAPNLLGRMIAARKKEIESGESDES